MRNAIIISLLLHISVYFISTRIVQFTRVKYIPRQVYSVNLLTMEEIEKMMEKKTAPPPEEQVPEKEPAPPPEKEPAPPPEELVPPTETKKPAEKKKEPAKKNKQVPSTEAQKPVGAEDPTGASSGDSSDQASTGDINLDIADFPFGYYLITIRRKIAGNWTVPQTQSNQELSCRVHFKIARNGQIVSPDIEQSSGSFMFDQAALRAVMQASPLPPLPSEFRDNFLGVHFSFAYEEN